MNRKETKKRAIPCIIGVNQGYLIMFYSSPLTPKHSGIITVTITITITITIMIIKITIITNQIKSNQDGNPTWNPKTAIRSHRIFMPPETCLNRF